MLEQREQEKVQLEMLEKCLVLKQELLEKLYMETREQEAILDTAPFSEEAFEATLKKKEEQLALLEKYDQGFEQIYVKIKEPIAAQKERYKEQIQKMQEKIRAVTELGVRLQALEQKNRIKLEVYLNSKRQEIKKFNVNNRTVSNYYKTMASAGTGETYFMDKKR